MEKNAIIRETGFYKRPKVIIIGVLAIAIILAIVYTAFAAESGSGDYKAQGNLKYEETDLNSKIAGNVQQVLVEEGDTVKKGDTLVIINSNSIEAKKLQAEGALAAATATYSKAKNGARSQEVTQAKAAADMYAKTYERVKSLYEDGAVSENDYDQVHAQYIAAQETYSMALQGARPEDIAAAKALVDEANGAIAEVNSYLQDCVIKASMDGVVTAVNVNAGELVSTGMPLVSLADRTDPWVDVSVMETQLSNVKKGGTVNVTFAAYPDKKVEGVIADVSEEPDFAVKRATSNNGDFDILSYNVKVKLKDHDGIELHPGMTVEVDFGKKLSD